MWSGAIGLLLHYTQSALPGETLVQFAARMTTTPATLETLQLLRLPLALLSALVVVLAFLEGFSYQEIADIMDLQLGTVKSRLHRGRKLLQKVLWDYAIKNGYIKGTTK